MSTEHVPTLTEIEAEARRLIAIHCPTVAFKWDNAVRRAGLCKFRRATVRDEFVPALITLSRPIFAYSDEAKRAATDVILHEIAHALAGADENHGYAWRTIARSLGCSAMRCHTLPVPPSGIVHLCSEGCTHHGTPSVRTRMPKAGKSYICRACRVRVTFARAGEVVAA